MIIKPKTKQLIQRALKEDIGAGDITSLSVISKSNHGKFVIIAKEPCVVCGLPLAEACFTTVNDKVHFRPMASDGTEVPKDKIIAHVEGPVQGVLMAERTALNFLGWLSGISTLTNAFVSAVKAYKTEIMDTRKTIPTMRFLQKYAVKIGGGKNHRMGLYDQVLIKDNHLSSLGKSQSVIKEAIKRARENAPKNKKIEIEVTSLSELKEALELNADIIMLDNMNINDIKEAVRIRDAHRVKQQDVGFKTLLEVSGRVNLETSEKIAQTGVDRISIGALTHSAPAVDFSLKSE